MSTFDVVNERLRERLVRNGDCWEYDGHRSRFGHGLMSYRGKTRQTHRLAWEAVNGPIPDGMIVCHVCDNPPCCNPDHLSLGTKGDNNRDRDAKGRTKRGPTTLTAETALELVRAYVAGESTPVLAARYEISASHVLTVVFGRAWAKATSEVPLDLRRQIAAERTGSKLSGAQALEVVRRFVRGEASATLAREFGISESTVQNLVNGRFHERETSIVPLTERAAAMLRAKRNVPAATIAAYASLVGHPLADALPRTEPAEDAA